MHKSGESGHIFISYESVILTQEPNPKYRCPNCGATCLIKVDEDGNVKWKFCPIERKEVT